MLISAKKSPDPPKLPVPIPPSYRRKEIEDNFWPKFKRTIERVPGVADVNALGGYVRSFEVVPNVASMSARNISLMELQNAIQINNRNDGAGRMDVGEETLLVRIEGRLKSSRDIENIVVALRNGVPVRIGDIAEVRIGHLTRYGAVSDSSGKEAVEGLVLALRGANARQLVEGVKEKLTELPVIFHAQPRSQIAKYKNNCHLLIHLNRPQPDSKHSIAFPKALKHYIAQIEHSRSNSPQYSKPDYLVKDLDIHSLQLHL